MSTAERPLWGPETEKALGNFRVAGKPVDPVMVHCYGHVKSAAAATNHRLGYLPTPVALPLIRAAGEMARGELDSQVVVDALQGGAGTSLNMNVNEVLARRAGELGSVEVSPLEHVNLHQSTNDTFPTALRLAAIVRGRELETALLKLQEALQAKEAEFADLVKMGRTQLRDAVLTTLGRSFGAWAEAFNRDRWRIERCEERLRVVNLGGTAIGTGLGAPRDYIFQVVDNLKKETGIGLARAENLVEATQNADAFAEVSGMLATCATNMIKVACDLRLLSSGPEAGIGEINLPPMQAGSSIMPGKVNPVIPEAAVQAGLMTLGHHSALNQACALGCLELNPFMPLVAHALLESQRMLTEAAGRLRTHCVEGITANPDALRRHSSASTAEVTALIQRIGYGRALEIARTASLEGMSVREAAMAAGITDREFRELVGPEAVTRLGMPERAHEDP
jgi:aspartate ammonia-lyase